MAVLLVGCGELAENTIERPVVESAKYAAREQVQALLSRGPEGYAQLAAVLRRSDVTGETVEAVGRALIDPPAAGWEERGLEVLAEPLLRLAEDEARTTDERRWALIALRTFAVGVRQLAPRIWLLLDDEELFLEAWGALMEMRWEPLIDVLIRTLDSDHAGHRWGAIRDLGAFGPKASRAVPALAAKLLGDEPSDERAEVVASLAEIGTSQAQEALVRALDSPRWLDVKHATLAILELSIFEAEPALRRVSQTHWRPGIRRLTEVAADVLGRCSRGDPPQTNHIKLSGECFKDGKPPAVVELEGRLVDVPVTKRPRPPDRPVGFPGAVTFGDEESCVRDYARLDGGWAVAIDCGEWGGGVDFVADDGERRVLSPLHSDQFVRLGDRLYAVGGLFHMGLNIGAVVELDGDSNGRWRARETAQPIGTPWARLLTKHGLILVGFYGATLLRPDGTQQELACGEAAKSP